MKPFKPHGIEFFDAASCRQMMLVTEGSWAGWLVYKHPDGQWVSLRKATDDDRRAVLAASLPIFDCRDLPSELKFFLAAAAGVPLEIKVAGDKLVFQLAQPCDVVIVDGKIRVYLAGS